MRVMTIGIKSESEAREDFRSAFEAAQKRQPFKPRTGFYFTSLEAVRNFLTPRRLELLHSIRERRPHSIYALAKSVQRSFPSVLRDVNLLAKHGLVKLTRTPQSPRRPLELEVGYDAIHLWIGV